MTKSTSNPTQSPQSTAYEPLTPVVPPFGLMTELFSGVLFASGSLACARLMAAHQDINF